MLDSGKFVEHLLDSDDIELSDMDKNSDTNFTEQRVIHCYLTLEMSDMGDCACVNDTNFFVGKHGQLH